MNKTLKNSLRLGALLAAGICNLAQAAGSADLIGFWQPVKKVETLLTADGKTPPLTAEGKKVYEANLAAAKAGKRDFDIERKCLPLGLTRLMAESSFELFQSKKEVGFIFEWNHVVHMMNLRDKHDRVKYESQYAYPYYNGHSIASIKGNALVTDSIYFNEDNTLDKSGLPHSEDLQVTQSLSLKDANTLLNVVTIKDPRFYSKAWSTQFTYTRMPAGTYLKDDVCVDRLGIKKLNSEQ